MGKEKKLTVIVELEEKKLKTKKTKELKSSLPNYLNLLEKVENGGIINEMIDGTQFRWTVISATLKQKPN